MGEYPAGYSPSNYALVSSGW